MCFVMSFEKKKTIKFSNFKCKQNLNTICFKKYFNIPVINRLYEHIKL